jgi:hypothetical protein
LVILSWDSKRLRWCVPFLFWIWAATHGGFLFGFAYVGLRILQSREWRSWNVVAISVGASLLTAHGLGVIEMLTSFLHNREYLALITEWRTPNLFEIDLIPFVVAIALIVFGATRGRLRAGDLWLLLPFLALALSSERAVGMAWVVFVPLMARALGGLQPRWSRGFDRRVAVAIVGLVLVLPVVLVDESVLDVERFPVAAADHLDRVPTFHGDVAGGFLIWSAWPEHQVFIDDRVELYGERLEEFVDIRLGDEDWRPVFERDGIVQALLEGDEPLVAELRDDGWSATYEDPSFVVLAKP